MKGSEFISLPAVALEDDLGIVYLMENAQQFWSELEDVLRLPSDDFPTLSLLDATLKRFLALCAAYHEQYLQSPLQLEHACDLLLNSELFTFHSDRMCDILVEDARSTTNPHSQLVFFHTLLCYGRRRPDFFRSQKRWQPLIPLLMDHVLVEIEADIEDTYFGVANVAPGSVAVPVPIEAKLRSMSVNLLYEVCRVRILSVQDLRTFDDAFIDYLFDLVEQTRNMQDDTFNYSVIKLIVALNEQFMVASLNAASPELLGKHDKPPAEGESKNRVLRVLMRRLGHSKTFGENMIFMLNRAERTAEDLCMQLLVLKLLYLLFTTKGTSEYFYTNDLCVLVDVFLRELLDLDEEHEALRHTYLRVLHPLLTKTQLRTLPYKRPQIVLALESLMQNSNIREIDPTTRRLVERCLSGEWCVQYRKAPSTPQTDSRGGSPSHDSVASAAQAQPLTHGASTSSALERTGSFSKARTLKASRSMEVLKGSSAQPIGKPVRPVIETARRPSNASLTGVASAAAPVSPAARRKALPSSAQPEGAFAIPAVRPAHPLSDSGTPSHHHHHHHQHHHQHLRPDIPAATNSLPTTPLLNVSTPALVSERRRPAPPPPPKRRKPPAIPVGRVVTKGGATITAIKSTVISP